MALTDLLIGYWKLEEASGSRLDETANNLDLTDVNTVTQMVGKLGNAALFTVANAEQLTRASEANLECGDIDFTFAVWVYLENLNGYNWILAKDNADSSLFEYILWKRDANDILFQVKTAGGTQTVTSATFGSLAADTWTYIVCWHDAAANTINLQVNNGGVDSAGTGGALNAADATYTFHIGGRGAGSTWDGGIDSVGFWKRVLTADERTSLYNSGNGLEYPFSSYVPRHGFIHHNNPGIA